MIVGGSDARLSVNPVTHLNGYGCQPWPRPGELSFSSSTASTISERGYAGAETAYREMGKGGSDGLQRNFARLADGIRSDIKSLLELPPDTDIVLAPSGTDSELQALFVARCVLGAPTVSIIVAADETGSGVGLAASGRHFEMVTSCGQSVVKGEGISGLVSETPTVAIAARDEHGKLRPLADIDAEVFNRVADALDGGCRAIVHVMHHSKTGARGPSDACVAELTATFGPRVQIVIDACQVRIGRAQLRKYLDLGCLVLITGSKFFGGPPLSGALLVPSSIAARMKNVTDVPDGLTDYSSRHDWPAHWTGIREKLPASLNAGQILRWTAAVAEMHAYFKVPEMFRMLALREFGTVFSRAIERHSNFQSLTNDRMDHAEDDGEFAVPTVFPFLLRRDGRLLTMNESKLLYRALNEDVSSLFPAGSDADLGARLCHIGQPVAVQAGDGSVTGALRISVDARLVSQCWFGTDGSSATERMLQSFGQVNTVPNKLALLVNNLDRVEGALASRV